MPIAGSLNNLSITVDTLLWYIADIHLSMNTVPVEQRLMNFCPEWDSLRSAKTNQWTTGL